MEKHKFSHLLGVMDTAGQLGGHGGVWGSGADKGIGVAQVMTELARFVQFRKNQMWNCDRWNIKDNFDKKNYNGIMYKMCM